MPSQTAAASQSARVLEPQVFIREETQIFPEDELGNCRLCGELCAGDLCYDCGDSLTSDSLAAFSDRLLAEEDSAFDQALRIADGTEPLLLPTRAHLRALYEQLVRSEQYTQELERSCSAMIAEVSRINTIVRRHVLAQAETEAIQ